MNKKGSILILAMLVIVVLIVFGAVLVSRGTSERVLVQQHDEYAQALWLADAGVHRTIAALDNDDWPVPPWSKTPAAAPAGEANLVAQPLGGGTYTVIATNLTTNDPHLFSTGTVGNLNRTLDVDLVRTELNPLKNAAFGVTSITMDGSVSTDSYKSTCAPPAAAGNEGNIGSDGSVTFHGNPPIDGNVVLGPGASVSGCGGTCYNDTQNNTEPAYIPMPEVPSGYSSSGNIDFVGAGVITINDGEYREYGVIKLKTNQTLHVTGDAKIYVSDTAAANSLIISGTGKIQIDPGASLEIYVDGNVSLTGQGVANDLTNGPDSFVLFGTTSGSNIKISGQGTLSGVVYAPGSSIQVTGTGPPPGLKIEGSLIGDVSTLGGNVHISYDECLKFFKVGSAWYEVAEWKEQQEPYPIIP